MPRARSRSAPEVLPLALSAARQASDAALDGARALAADPDFRQRFLLGHSAARAAHAAAEALAVYASAPSSLAWSGQPTTSYSFPELWKGVVDRLGMRLVRRGRRPNAVPLHAHRHPRGA